MTGLLLLGGALAVCVIDEQPHDENRQRLAGFLRQLRPLWHACGHPPLRSRKQIELACHGLARHGHLSDSFRERPMLRPLPQIAMRRRRLPVTLPKHAGSRDRHAELAGCANIRSRNGRTSMMELQKADQKKHQIGCSGKCPYLWPAHHGHARADRTKDATDIKAHEPPSCGCSVVVLYNHFRPHSSLGYKTPANFAGTIAATGSNAAQDESFAFPPVAHTAPFGVFKAAGALVAAG
ncbi:transposase [Rhizobium leguminosarum]|nr:transposase [Rhizobium leguminosarum]